MPFLTLPAGFPLPKIVTELSPRDTMFDGRDVPYLSVGLSALQAIEAAIGNAQMPRRILDMPCGHGRVTRVLRARFPDAAITVCDIDRDDVDFASDRFSARGVYSDTDFRRLAFGETYDLIWVGSLITHLSELMTLRFFDFAVRHMTSRSTLVLSSHGDFVAGRMHAMTYDLPPWDVDSLLLEHSRTDYGYRNYPDCEHYGIAVIGRRWFENAVEGSPLWLSSYVERGWDDHHDVLSFRLRRGRMARQSAGAIKHFMRELRVRKGRRATAHADAASRGTTVGYSAAPKRYKSGWFEAQYRRRCTEHARMADDRSDAGSPSVHLDEGWYLDAYPDVSTAIKEGKVRSSIDHYLRYGSKEGRLPLPPAKEVVAAATFDEAWYLRSYPDVVAAIREGTIGSGYDHWKHSGKAEGRIPPPGFVEEEPEPPDDGFDGDWYLRMYTDVASAIEQRQVRSALDHYLRYGREEGRLPRPPEQAINTEY
jgi:SAM-dependent methyltransferase